MKFEKAVEELKKIVQELEDEALEVEKAIELYEKGNELARIADDILTKAELKIKELNKDNE